jgi:Zn ribbon nucleic-acid-binding protein
MINKLCPPHRWFVPGGKDGIAIAKCIECGARQYQSTDRLRETVMKAVKLNIKYHRTRTVVGKKVAQSFAFNQIKD